MSGGIVVVLHFEITVTFFLMGSRSVNRNA
jgi:hypothetical protein